MSEDDEYFANYTPNRLFVSPAKEGAYASAAVLSEEAGRDLGELEITSRLRIGVKVFYVSERGDWSSLKLTKLRFHKTRGWLNDGELALNGMTVAKVRDLLALFASLDLKDAAKAKIDLGALQIEHLGTLLASDKGPELIRQLSESPDLHHDIYALTAKRESLQRFAQMMTENLDEASWQGFFEANTWIFGHGLFYRFIDKVADKLEAVTTGASFNTPGKRADGLMRTRAEISQFVFVEIKKNDTPLVARQEHRPGCWAVDTEVSRAVTQVQKTVFEFSRRHFRERLKDATGRDTGDEVYAVEPRSYLVIGNLGQLAGHDDKLTCFELYRRNVRAPEILTFDELYQRAKCIIETLSWQMKQDQRAHAGKIDAA